MYIVRSFAINAAEARYLLAAYTSAGIYAPDLDHRVRGLTRVLGKEGYFLESGRWNAQKWRETDFIILKDAGPVNDRITEFEEDEQRMATATWWLMNLCMQLEALGLEFNRPLEGKVDFGYSAPPIEAPTLVSVSTPELVQRAVDAAVKKYRTLSTVQKGKEIQSNPDRVGYPAALFPMRHEYILTLRPEEPSKLIKLLKSEPESVTYTMVLELLGDELTEIFLKHHVLVPVQADQPGLIRVNLHVLKAMTIRVHAHKLRVNQNKKTGYPNLDSLLAQLDNLSKDYRKGQTKSLADTNKAAIKTELSKVEVPVPESVPKVETIKPPAEKRLTLKLSYEEVTAFRDLLNKWETGVKAEEGEQAFGVSLYQALLGGGYLWVNADSGLLNLNEAQFAEIFLHPTKKTDTNRFCMTTGLLPSQAVTLKERLRRIARTVRRGTGVSAVPDGLWRLYLKVEETEKFLNVVTEGAAVPALRMSLIFGEAVLKGLCLAGLFTKAVDGDTLLPVWSELNKLIIHDWLSNGRPKARFGKMNQSILPAQDLATRLRSLHEKQTKTTADE